MYTHTKRTYERPELISTRFFMGDIIGTYGDGPGIPGGEGDDGDGDIE